MAYKSLQLVLALAGIVAAVPAPVASDIIPGKFIVTLRPEVELDLHTRWVSEVHGEGLRRRGGDSVGVENTFDAPGIHGYAGSFDEETVATIKANSSVLYVEEDRIVRAAALTTQSSPPWGLAAISNSPPVAANAGYKYDSTAGAGTFSYIVDSGIRLTHNEFQGRAVAGFTVGGTTNQRHGTLVAAIVGGATYGVAKKTTVVDVQVMKSDEGTTSDIIRGLAWIVNDVRANGRSGKSVANLSLGGGPSQALNDACQAIIDAGATVIVSAGNSFADASNSSPANQPNVITVAACDRNYKSAYFTNFGSVVHIFAPGVGITSAVPDSDTATATFDGTSEAAPHVAGVAAYLLAKEGSRTPAQLKARITELSIKNIIQDPKGSGNRFLFNGGGI
ncbi:peptidase S8/S53 domain-containing protein [Microdochium bolleyi]|uniref:Peptidase S8/S53 domain-containing protein n=1 Tax=Microdochium bolleyi TaxID=196109 RepID=A0A136JJE2_9PEZI|nr:peptidase S8/S53 domain-containing protein [Microdochium bolleyi]